MALLVRGGCNVLRHGGFQKEDKLKTKVTRQVVLIPHGLSQIRLPGQSGSETLAQPGAYLDRRGLCCITVVLYDTASAGKPEWFPHLLVL